MTFHREFVNHRFLVRVSSAHGVTENEFSSWGGAVNGIRSAYRTWMGLPVRAGQMRSIYISGYGLIHGLNVRVIPLP